jgi:hypothetical protein
MKPYKYFSDPRCTNVMLATVANIIVVVTACSMFYQFVRIPVVAWDFMVFEGFVIIDKHIDFTFVHFANNRPVSQASPMVTSESFFQVDKLDPRVVVSVIIVPYNISGSFSDELFFPIYDY